MNAFDNIKAIAAERGMTIKSLAEKAGISENSIYRWKRTNPSTKSLDKVAKVLNVSTAELISDNSDEDIELQAIQRKAKELSAEDKRRLLQLIELVFEKNK